MTIPIVTGLATIALLCAVATPRVAWAQSASDSAQQHFDRGAKLYNLGHFQEAIPEFEKAYELDTSPIFLFNIAQSHRQLGNKERALFFYRRYLEQAPNAANRDDVERRMKDLQSALQQEGEGKPKPPTDVPPPRGGGTGEGGAEPPVTPPPPPDVQPPGGNPPGGNPPPPAVERRTWVFDVQAGPAFLSASGNTMISLPSVFFAGVQGAYAFPAPGGEMRLGVDLGYARLPYTNAMMMGGNTTFWSVLGAIRYMFALAPGFRLGLGVEGGAIWWAGLETMGNPFTIPGASVSGGAIPMPTVGGGLRLEYTVSDGFFLMLSPEILWNKTTSDGLTQSISSLTRFNLTAGLSYTF